MTSPASEILASLQALSASDRAEIAAALLESIDGEGDDNFAAEWDQELVRRCEDIASGRVQDIPAEEVFATVVRKYS